MTAAIPSHAHRHRTLARWPDLPPASLLSQSPYDPDARYCTKRETKWTGYRVHLTETCEPDEPHLVVHVASTPATTHDSKLVETIHANLAANQLLPGEHLVDQGYMDTELLLTSQAEHGVDAGCLERDCSRRFEESMS